MAAKDAGRALLAISVRECQLLMGEIGVWGVGVKGLQQQTIEQIDNPGGLVAN